GGQPRPARGSTGIAVPVRPTAGHLASAPWGANGEEGCAAVSAAGRRGGHRDTCRGAPMFLGPVLTRCDALLQLDDAEALRFRLGAGRRSLLRFFTMRFHDEPPLGDPEQG